MHLRHQLFRNSFTTLVQILVGTVLGLVLVPILLSRLGLEIYGIWALMILVNSYTGLLDLGFQSSLVKLISENRADGNTERVLGLVNTSLWIYVGIFFVSSFVSWMGGEVLTEWLLHSLPDPGPYTKSFQVYIIVSLSALLTIPFASLLKGLHRYDQSNLLEIVAMAINATCSIFFVVAGFGLWGLVIGAAASVLWRLFSYPWLARRAFPSLRLQWVPKGSGRMLRELFRLSPADQSVRIYSVLTQSVVRLSISAFAGVAFVGIYDIAKRIVSQASAFPCAVFTPLVPAISSLASEGRRESMEELLRRCLLYLSMVSLPLIYFLLIFYDPILKVWLGISDVSSISQAGRLLLVAAFLELFTGPATTAALGLGTPNLHVVKLALVAVLHVVLVPGLGYLFGFPGMVAGETAAVLVGAAVTLITFEIWFHIPVLHYSLDAIRRVTFLTGPIWLILGGVWLFFRHLPVWQSLLGWGGMLATGLVIIGFFYWIKRLLTHYEWDVAVTALVRHSAG